MLFVAAAADGAALIRKKGGPAEKNDRLLRPHPEVLEDEKNAFPSPKEDENAP